jgi:hypothetical protein
MSTRHPSQARSVSFVRSCWKSESSEWRSRPSHSNATSCLGPGEVEPVATDLELLHRPRETRTPKQSCGLHFER